MEYLLQTFAVVVAAKNFHLIVVETVHIVTRKLIESGITKSAEKVVILGSRMENRDIKLFA